MAALNPQAQELNLQIETANPAVLHLLSAKGKAIFFPKQGILAQSAEAKGSRLNATIGIAFEDDMTPMRLACIADRIKLDPAQVFPYAPGFGKPELRTKWRELMRQKNPSLQTATSLPIVTGALTHGLSMIGYLFIDPGDTIILPDKFWGNYRLIFTHGYGAKLAGFNTFTATGFDTAALREALARQNGKTIVLLNFPNNPTGYTPTETEAQEIVAIIRAHAEAGNETVVICDDAYFGLVYQDGILAESLFARLAACHENILAIKADGPTKEDYVWGFRVGFVTYAAAGMTPETYTALENKTAGAIRGSASNLSHPGQSLLIEAFSSDSYAAEKKAKYDLLQTRFNAVRQTLSDNKFAKYFSPLPYNSGYFMCIELRDGREAETVRQRLLQEYSTGLIAIGTMLRIAFSAVPAAEIPGLFENIYNACSDCGA